MDPTLRELIDRSTFHKGSVREVAALLPADEGELDALVGEAVAGCDMRSFVLVVAAALDAGRRVDVRHMGQAASMTSDHFRFCNLAIKMRGDLPAACMTAILRGGIGHETITAAMLLTAVWCRDHTGGVLPEGFLAEVKAMARKQNLRDEVQAFLISTLFVVRDPSLKAIFEANFAGVHKPDWEANTQKFLDAVLERIHAPVLTLFSDEPPKMLAAGITMRRSVEKFGRNDQCHCGSGKKYKRCCFAKDEERLHHSTNVAGKTYAELRDAPETDLTIHRIEKMHRHELERLDPLKIPEILHQAYILRATPFGVFERVVEFFERVEWNEVTEKLYYFAAMLIMRAGRKEYAARMVAAFEKARPGADVRLDLLLLAADGRADEELHLIEKIAFKAMKETNPDRLTEFALAVLYSRHKALGILVCRSVIPLMRSKKGSVVLNEILLAHDKLDLPPDDPFSDVLEKRIAEETGDEGKDAAGLRAARKKLDAKAAEVRQLKEDIERQRREVRRHEKQRPAETVAHNPADEAELRDLRQKLATLKSTLHERAEERTALRRDLEAVRDALEKTRAAAAPKTEPANGDEDDEAGHYLPEQSAGNQPLRIIEFPPKFRETLDDFPQQISRAALAMAGRLAGGEPAAFSGVVALKAIPGVYRQRIGIDHRLLFRLHPDRVQLIALINRRDLDRKIKGLRA